MKALSLSCSQDGEPALPEADCSGDLGSWGRGGALLPLHSNSHPWGRYVGGLEIDKELELRAAVGRDPEEGIVELAGASHVEWVVQVGLGWEEGLLALCIM
jgi:hypothetical protein